LGGGLGIELTGVEDIGLATVVQELQNAQPDCQIISDISIGRSVRLRLGKTATNCF
jgi:hypothetical protein